VNPTVRDMTTAAEYALSLFRRGHDTATIAAKMGLRTWRPSSPRVPYQFWGKPGGTVSEYGPWNDEAAVVRLIASARRQEEAARK
jgi:hypothetical protein